MALSVERYSFSFETRGIARAVNVSTMMVLMDGNHWLVGVASIWSRRPAGHFK